MEMVSLFYILNATLLILHEIESAFEKEWEILRLPGKITGFLLLHIPLILIIFYGLLEVNNHSKTGQILAMITGIGGIMPFIVHKIIVYKKEHFNSWISNTIIYLNIATGIGTVIFAFLINF